ncbi:wee1-like protein kinase isoform X2 [Drosophila obscura]|uniref:wee1-like protein kinase isoform X2 n=1 Tax=Drosophila obscura TaxID=7282 RepID=UPI001BB139F6|nr:wee1-like protein kinase isoform X2 [Drosophila obscura]
MTEAEMAFQRPLNERSPNSRRKLYRLRRSYRLANLHVAQDTVHVNPFTPDSLVAHTESEGPEDVANSMGEMCQTQTPKRLALDPSRLQSDFAQVRMIGSGEFGVVFHCVNRLDGCAYAIKKSKVPVIGSAHEKSVMNEVWAHAVLGKHDNVVRYYSAWTEDYHLVIQSELCDGGSLHARIQDHCLGEAELKIVLLHVIEGLRYIHSNDLAHMDLKPENIFCSMNPNARKLEEVQPQQTEEDDELNSVYGGLRPSENLVTYKIGDLGHVTSVVDPRVKEGDCRYLAKEILKDNYMNLFAADIFSLGITLFEVAGGGPLPKNGPWWHNLRDGEVPHLPKLSKEFNELIAQMMHPDPDQRPTSQSIFTHPFVSSIVFKSNLNIGLELTMEKRKSQLLMNKLRIAREQIKVLEEKDKSRNGQTQPLPAKSIFAKWFKK